MKKSTSPTFPKMIFKYLYTRVSYLLSIFYSSPTPWLNGPNSLFLIKGFRTTVFMFIPISTIFRSICPPVLFRCLSNSGTFTELGTTSFIDARDGVNTVLDHSLASSGRCSDITWSRELNPIIYTVHNGERARQQITLPRCISNTHRARIRVICVP